MTMNIPVIFQFLKDLAANNNRSGLMSTVMSMKPPVWSSTNFWLL